MTFLRMEDLDLTGKQVLIREDLNVPVKDGIVSNDMRIRAALPTIEQAMARSKKVILMSHLGRPEEGRPMSTQREFSLRPVANRLTELLACQVELIEGYLDDPDTVSKYDAGIVLLENVRINSGEKAKMMNWPLAMPGSAMCSSWMPSGQRIVLRLALMVLPNMLQPHALVHY